ncbi:MAG: hypothetical protein ABI467_12260 [Kofleriaceae bacterium]
MRRAVAWASIGHPLNDKERFVRLGLHVTFDVWTAKICDRFKLPTKPCKDELRDVVQSCNEDLTGAGP